MAISIRKDKDGKPRAYQVAIRLPGERSSCRTFASYEAAEEYETNTMEAIKAAKSQAFKRRSAATAAKPAKLASFVTERVADVVDLYVADHPGDKVSVSAEALKRRVGDAEIGHLTKKWGRDFCERMRGELGRNRKTTLKESTINWHMRMIGRVCKWRAECLEVDCPPLGLSTKHLDKGWNDGRTRRLRGDEEARIRASLARIGKRPRWDGSVDLTRPPTPLSQHYTAAFELALETCAREAELISMEWADLHMECREWVIPAHKNKSRRARTIYLSLKALAIFNRLSQDRDSESDFVLHRLPTPAAFSAHFSGRVKALGIKDLVFHDLRHDAITNWLNSGAILPGALMKMVGHADLKMTMRYFNPQRDEIIGKMDGVLARRDAAYELEELQATVPPDQINAAPAPQIRL